MRTAVAKGLRGLHRAGSVVRSQLRLWALKARFPGFHTEGRVSIGPNCQIIVNAGSTLWLRNTSVERDVTIVVSNGGTLDYAGFRIGRGCYLVCQERITLGPGGGIAEYTIVRDAQHRPNVPLEENVFDTAPVLMGDDVGIGANCTILKGVTMGDEAVVAAGAVVLDDVPARKTVAGVPARVVADSPNWGRSTRMSDPNDPGIPDEDVNADDLPDDPITAREAAEQVLIEEDDSEAGAELGDEID
jgi:acetyltransferase-like isoleucine patch superfamily enzyme